MMEHQTKGGESKIVATLHVPAHRHCVRQPDLHGSRGHRRHAEGLRVRGDRSTAWRSPSSHDTDRRAAGDAAQLTRSTDSASRRQPRSPGKPGQTPCRTLSSATLCELPSVVTAARSPMSAPTISARFRSRALIERNSRRRLGRGRRRRLRLRQPGRRGQPQRRAHGAAAGRAAGRCAGHDGESAVRIEHGRDRHRRARDQERRDLADDRRRRRKHVARAVRDGQGRAARSRAPRRSRTRPSAGASSIR